MKRNGLGQWLLVVLAVGLLGADGCRGHGCDGQPDDDEGAGGEPPAEPTLLEVARTTEDHDVDAFLYYVDLDDELSAEFEENTLTVVMPTNAAMAELSGDCLGTLENNADARRAFVWHHMSQGWSAGFDTLPGLNGAAVQMRSRQNLEIGRSGDVWTIDGAEVLDILQGAKWSIMVLRDEILWPEPDELIPDVLLASCVPPV